MNITELKQRPELFEKAYRLYCENNLDYEWCDFTFEDIKSQWAEKKLHVGNVYFDLYRRCAAFEGEMDMWDFLQMQGLEDEYLALAALHSVGDDATLKAYTSQRCDVHRVDVNENHAYYLQYQTAPCGIFEGMDEDEWCELVGREIESVVEAWGDFCTDLSHEILRQLDYEYEYLTSEEAFIEWAVANEIEFDGGECE